MLGALPDQNLWELFRPLPADLIAMRHELALLANRVDWNYFETEFSPLYATGGQLGVPVSRNGRLPAFEANEKSGGRNHGEGMDRKSVPAVFLRDAVF